MEKNCAVVSGGAKSTLAGIENADFVVAVDHGLDYLLEAGIRPDLAMGDFDSCAGNVPSGVKSVRLPRRKADTDTLAAFRHCLDLGYRNFTVYCAFGRRLDHLLANIQSFAFLAGQGGNVRVIGDDDELILIHDTEIILPARGPDHSLSVLSLSQVSLGVDIEGAEYEVHDFRMESVFPIGVSNEWKHGDVRIAVKQGTLAVIVSRKR